VKSFFDKARIRFNCAGACAYSNGSHLVYGFCTKRIQHSALIYVPFLVTFAKLRKETAGSYISVRLFVCPRSWDNSVPAERIFMKFDTYFSKIRWKSSGFIKIWQE